NWRRREPPVDPVPAAAGHLWETSMRRSPAPRRARRVPHVVVLAAALATMARVPTVSCDTTVIFSDNSFQTSSWTQSLLYQNDYGNCGGPPNASFTVSRQGSGGNTGAYRRVTHSWNDGELSVAHLKTSAVYDPAATGQISSITYSADVDFFTGAN